MTFSCICLCLMHAEVVLVHSLMRLPPTHPFVAPTWSITFDGARERGLIKGGFILVHVSANIMVRLRMKVWAHVCMRVLIVQVVNLRFFDLRRCHMKGVHWVFKTSHNTSVHMLGQHGGGGCPRTPPLAQLLVSHMWPRVLLYCNERG